MAKRAAIIAFVVAAFLMLAVPALAFNGYRADYTTAVACQTCHSGIAGIPAVYAGWSKTKHAEDEAYSEVAGRLPYSSVCQGCHTSNFAPSKLTPVPTATRKGVVQWGASPSTVTEDQTVGRAAWSEGFIGCSSCHYGANVAGGLTRYGVDKNDTAHTAPFGLLANPDICGACHSRYSYTVKTFAVKPIPTPTASPTTLIQPQMALGYPMLGSPVLPAPGWNLAAPLSVYLTYPKPGWSPKPNPTATEAGFGRLMTYWQVDGRDSIWQQIGHDGSAAQYPEWKSEGHANALTALTSEPSWASLPDSAKAGCLECHSADYRMLREAGKNPSPADAQYGVTCVGCHDPHNAGTIAGVWDQEFDAQLVNDANLGGNGSNLCTECHNGELPEGTEASPGAEIHHPMKEMMDGYGAVDVSSFPSVHKGKCIQCHMPPTSWSRGSVQLGANHTFNIIRPKTAMAASPVPVATATTVETSTPEPNGPEVVTTTLTVTQDVMPYSACSTCHSNNNGVKAVPQPISTETATPDPNAIPLAVTVTITQNANQSAVSNSSGGDRALWLQDTIVQRQTWTKAKIDAVYKSLDKAATVLGYADRDAARTALVEKPANTWTTAERAFLSGLTNVEFVASEGSYGLHNWDYSREIVNKAMQQAKVAQTGVVVRLPWVVKLKLSKSTMKVGAKVTFSGTVTTAKGVAGTGAVKIAKRVSGAWKAWKSAKLTSGGKYTLKVKMTKSGQFYFRAVMPADDLNAAGKSVKRKLVVNK